MNIKDFFNLKNCFILPMRKAPPALFRKKIIMLQNTSHATRSCTCIILSILAAFILAGSIAPLASAHEMPQQIPTAIDASGLPVQPCSMTERVISYDEEYTCPQGLSAHYYFHRNYKDLVFKTSYSLDKIVPSQTVYLGCQCGYGTLKGWTYYYSTW